MCEDRTSSMPLSTVEKSLLVAAYFRGGSEADRVWTSNSDQIITLSLFYTGDISAAECANRFSVPGYVQRLYDEDGELSEQIEARYRVLIDLLREHPELIKGGGNFETPAHPTYTACRLTPAGLEECERLIHSFPHKPSFPNWPDKRLPPGAEWSDMLVTVKSREMQRAMVAETWGDRVAARRHFLAAAHLELVLAGDTQLAVRSRVSAGSCFWRGGEVQRAREQFGALIDDHPERAGEVQETVRELEQEEPAV